MFDFEEVIFEQTLPNVYDGMMSVALGLAAIGMIACLVQLAINKKRGIW